MKSESSNPFSEGKIVSGCHMCNSADLHLILDLGFHPHSDLFLKPNQLNEPVVSYPLRLVACGLCGLLQIDFLVNPQILYQREYLYESSITDTGKSHYGQMAKEIIDNFEVPDNSLVIDIGSNVGVLLDGFRSNGMRVLGVDPAEIVAQKAIDKGIETIVDFFGLNVAKKIKKDYGQARVISGTNVFAHLHELDDATEGMKLLLDPRGVIAIEAPYAVDFIEKLEYDTIYHQHVGYLSVLPMKKYFEKFDLELFDVVPTSIHGGSLRYYIGHKGAHKISSTIETYIENEKAFGLYDPEKLNHFAEQVKMQRHELLKLLLKLKSEGKRIAGVSAPAKGNTLLNYCSINTTYIDFLTEKSTLKTGRFTPGTFIPIYDDGALLEFQPDYALILAWNFAEEIMNNLSEYKKRGGKFIIPIPSPIVI